jgi:hypothetical protein
MKSKNEKMMMNDEENVLSEQNHPLFFCYQSIFNQINHNYSEHEILFPLRSNSLLSSFIKKLEAIQVAPLHPHVHIDHIPSPPYWTHAFTKRFETT